MSRRTPAELKKLTIPRLQALLKATRARYHAENECPCCGTTYKELYGKDHMLIKNAAPFKAYFEDVKAELKRRQSK